MDASLFTSPRKRRRTLTVTLVAIGALAQLAPYGRNHTNPPIVKEPRWGEASTRALARRACFDCHSNETRWPWYSHVAPVSWLVQSDVDRGRRALNFSEWNRFYPEADESSRLVFEGEMPPRAYALVHPAARLSATEIRALAVGLVAITGGAPEPQEDDEHGESLETAARARPID